MYNQLHVMLINSITNLRIHHLYSLITVLDSSQFYKYMYT